MWKEIELGYVLSERRETPDEIDLLSGRVPIISKIGFKSGQIELREGGKTRTKMILIKPGDLVLSGINAAKGAVAIYRDTRGPIAATIHYSAYEPDHSKVDAGFLWWLLRSQLFRSILVRHLPGGIKTELKAKRFLLIPIPLPPLKDQRQILAWIEALAGKVEEARRLREEGTAEVDAIMASTLSGIFDYEPNDRLPSDWRWLSFDELLANGKDGMRTGPFGTLLSKADIVQNGIPVLGIANVQPNKFVNGFKDYVSVQKAEALGQYELYSGDIVVARSGTVGRSCVIPDLITPAPIMSTNLIRIRLNEKVFVPKLLSRLFNKSRLVERHKDKYCRGSTRTFFTQKILKKLNVPVPPLERQEQIIAYLEQLQAKVDIVGGLQSTTQRELDALLPAILDKAFKGTL